jgi:glycosyltransferase involved in cell wall biosynthesis
MTVAASCHYGSLLSQTRTEGMREMRRILYLYHRTPRYIRNLVLRQALRQVCDVVEVTTDSSSILAGNTAVALRYLRTKSAAFDCVVIGFPGYLLVPWVRMWSSSPILFDPFVSTYDTFCLDRGWFGPRSLAGRLAFALDRHTCRLATRVLMDTQAHRDYFLHTFGLPAARFHVLYVGCDEGRFWPRPVPSHSGACQVFTYTSFLRLHGVEQILEAAKLLEKRREIVFTVAGDGARRRAMQELARKLGLENVQFPGWVKFEELPDRIAAADLCLGGHFSNVPKAARVVSTKTFQFLAMRRPVIVGDCPATREILTHGEHAWAVPMGNAEALAEAISELADDFALRQRLASGGRDLFERQFSTRALAEQLAAIVEEICTSAS